MTDRELLERAAKAGGIEVVGWSNDKGPLVDLGFPPVPWNPLTDDGEALRLAVKLCIQFGCANERTELFQCFYLDGLAADLRPTEATRRAIVRVAAEIGRAMP